MLFGRCAHRGALMSDGRIEGGSIVCGLHDWDDCYRSGISSYDPKEKLHRFEAWVEEGQVWVDEEEVRVWAVANPQPYDRDAYQGLYMDLHGGPEEPHFQYIQHLAEHGLSKVGHHGRVSAMGVPRDRLPKWEQIQLLTAQLYKVPLLDDAAVGTEAVIGPNARKPLVLERPLFVSDMSYGALATGAELARARHYLDQKGRNDVTLIITGGLRMPADFVKALALGADAIAVSNSALQAIGCLGMRACHTNNCPVGIATQNPQLRQRLKVETDARQLDNFFRAATELMQVMARACGHDHLNQFCSDDLTTWNREMAHLTGIAYGGLSLDSRGEPLLERQDTV